MLDLETIRQKVGHLKIGPTPTPAPHDVAFAHFFNSFGCSSGFGLEELTASPIDREWLHDTITVGNLTLEVGPSSDERLLLRIIPLASSVESHNEIIISVDGTQYSNERIFGLFHEALEIFSSHGFESGKPCTVSAECLYKILHYASKNSDISVVSRYHASVEEIVSQYAVSIPNLCDCIEQPKCTKMLESGRNVRWIDISANLHPELNANSIVEAVKTLQANAANTPELAALRNIDLKKAIAFTARGFLPNSVDSHLHREKFFMILADGALITVHGKKGSPIIDQIKNEYDQRRGTSHPKSSKALDSIAENLSRIPFFAGVSTKLNSGELSSGAIFIRLLEETLNYTARTDTHMGAVLKQKREEKENSRGDMTKLLKISEALPDMQATLSTIIEKLDEQSFALGRICEQVGSSRSRLFTFEERKRIKSLQHDTDNLRRSFDGTYKLAENMQVAINASAAITSGESTKKLTWLIGATIFLPIVELATGLQEYHLAEKFVSKDIFIAGCLSIPLIAIFGIVRKWNI